MENVQGANVFCNREREETEREKENRENEC